MRQWFRINARYAARHADTVLTVSQFSADQIAEHYGVPADRLVVIPNAVDPCFTPSAAERAPALLQRLGVTAPYLVTRSEEHTSELQSLMRISYAVFCLKK